MTIGERIRSIRLAKGLTQKQVALRCGMADSAIRKYESGVVTPKLDTLDRIALALGVPTTDLLVDVIEINLPSIDPSLGRIPTKDEIEKMTTDELELAILRALAAVSPDELFSMLTRAYNKLNRHGMIQAFLRVKELTLQKKYKKEPPQD